MADLALDNSGDLLFTNGNLTLFIDDDALVQHLQIRLRFFLAEWFLDTRLGIPYFENVLVKNPNLVIVRGILRQVILTTPGVASIEVFEFVFDGATRKMDFDFTVRKTDGEILVFDREFIIT